MHLYEKAAATKWKKELFKQKIKITNKLKPEIRVKLRLVISTEREHFITGISDIGGASITACARPWLVHCRLNHKFCFLKNMWGNNRCGVLKSSPPSGPVEKKTLFLPVKYTVCSVLLPFFQKFFFLTSNRMMIISGLLCGIQHWSRCDVAVIGYTSPSDTRLVEVLTDYSEKDD